MKSKACNLSRCTTLAALLLFAATPLLSQPYEIRGRVMDREVKEPLVGAVVMLFATQPTGPLDTGFCRTYTDNDGLFTIRKIPYDNFIIKTAFIGYYSLWNRMTIEHYSFTLDIYLKPEPIRMDEGGYSKPIITKETNSRQQVVEEEIRNSAGWK